MLPRIQTMRSMLKSTGVLAICIDYHELVRLMQLLDEMFGEENRIAIINWQKTTVNSMVKHVSVCVEYILVYAKNKENSETNLLPKSDEDFDGYKNLDNDPLGD
jgi:adenine-specific DNA-methyltransferase